MVARKSAAVSRSRTLSAARARTVTDSSEMEQIAWSGGTLARSMGTVPGTGPFRSGFSRSVTNTQRLTASMSESRPIPQLLRRERAP